MKYLQTRALVLSTRPLGETDRMLTLLTWEEGKVGARAPGARRVKSKLAATVELFTCGNFLLYRGRTLFTVTQAQVETTFRDLMLHTDDYARGLYFAELVERLLPEGEPNPAVFQLLMSGWSLLQQGKGDRDLLTRFFELRLLLLLGFRPHCDACIFCGAGDGPFYWSTAAGGVYCENCRPQQHGGMPLSRGTHALLKNLQRVSEREVAALRAQQAQQRELADFTAHFLHYWTDTGPFKSLAFLRDLRR